jgi:hypothetical protein
LLLLPQALCAAGAAGWALNRHPVAVGACGAQITAQIRKPRFRNDMSCTNKALIRLVSWLNLLADTAMLPSAARQDAELH